MSCRPLALALFLMAAGPAAAQSGAPPPREHAEMLAQMGGLYRGPVADYVARIGEQVAASAGKPGQCAFHVIDSEVVNAFTAPPACHIYVTRGLLAAVNGEGEVAAVLGHEIGHVAANHAGRREQRQQLTGIGAAILGAVTKSDLAGQIAGQAAQLYVLSYSRGQEYEADDLSVRYLAAGGTWSPQGLVGLLGALQRQDQLAQQVGQKVSQTPSWARTHPLTADRVARAAKAAEVAGAGRRPEDDARFYAAIDGLPVGADAASQGAVSGQSFVHPGLAIAFTAPTGYALTNGTQAVTIQGPGGVQSLFSGGRLQGSLEAYAETALRQLVGSSQVQLGQPERRRINGLDAVVLPAVGRARSGAMMDVIVTAYDAGGQGAYQFVTVAPQGQGRAVADQLAGSFHKLTPAEAGALRGPHIEVVTVRPGDTAEALSQRMAAPDHRLERFLALNGLDPGQALEPGRKLKLVTATSRPPSRPGGH